MANDFRGAAGCVAVYNFESGALGEDSKGSNDLTVTGVAEDTTNYKQGSCSADFEYSEGDYMSRADADLTNDFPLKNGTTNFSLSTTCWMKGENISASSYQHHIWSKNMGVWGDGTTLFVLSGRFGFRLRYLTSGDAQSLSGDVFENGRWYFVAVTYDHSIRRQRLYVWDDVLASVVYNTLRPEESGSDDLATDATAFDVGKATITNSTFARKWDGLIDEFTVWNRALSTDEIELIRDGLYTANWQGFFVTTVDLTAEAMSVITVAPWFNGVATWPISERLFFSTDILTSGNGTEQRIALRLGMPLQLFRIPFLLRTQAEAAEWSNMVHAWLKKMWPVPLWTESTRHPGSLAAGVSSIAIDTRYADYRANGLALVWEAGNAEMVEVSTVANDALTLATPLVRSHTGPLWVMPLRQGMVIESAVRTRHLGGASSIVEMAFAVDDIAEVTGWTAAMTYDDLDVLTEPAILESPEWVERIDPDVSILQNRTGRIGIVSVSDFNIAIQPHGWAPTTRAACWSLRQFLHAKRGRQKPFLVPTFHEDLVLSRACGAGDTSLYVVNRGHSRMGLNDLRTYLAFRPPQADIIPRKVTGISLVSATEELIAINTAPGRAFLAGTGLCWVDRCRLDRDEIDFEWYDRGALFCRTDLRRVPQ